LQSISEEFMADNGNAPALDIVADYETDLRFVWLRPGSALDTYAEFVEWYEGIIAACAARLRDNRFMVVKVGEIRDSHGAYRNFVGDTVAAGQKAGLAYYNEAIFITPAGSLPIRTAAQFPRGRKLGKTHQNVVILYKGDPTQVAAHFKEFIEHGDPTEYATEED
jgi:hypothetical protein